MASFAEASMFAHRDGNITPYMAYQEAKTAKTMMMFRRAGEEVKVQRRKNRRTPRVRKIARNSAKDAWIINPCKVGVDHRMKQRMDRCLERGQRAHSLRYQSNRSNNAGSCIGDPSLPKNQRRERKLKTSPRPIAEEFSMTCPPSLTSLCSHRDEAWSSAAKPDSTPAGVLAPLQSSSLPDVVGGAGVSITPVEVRPPEHRFCECGLSGTVHPSPVWHLDLPDAIKLSELERKNSAVQQPPSPHKQPPPQVASVPSPSADASPVGPDGRGQMSEPEFKASWTPSCVHDKMLRMDPLLNVAPDTHVFWKSLKKSSTRLPPAVATVDRDKHAPEPLTAEQKRKLVHTPLASYAAAQAQANSTQRVAEELAMHQLLAKQVKRSIVLDKQKRQRALLKRQLVQMQQRQVRIYGYLKARLGEHKYRTKFPWSFTLCARLWLKRRAGRIAVEFLIKVRSSSFLKMVHAVNKVRRATCSLQRAIRSFLECNRARQFVLVLCWHKIKAKLRNAKRKKASRKLSATYAQLQTALQASVDAGVQEKADVGNFRRRFSQAAIVAQIGPWLQARRRCYRDQIQAVHDKEMASFDSNVKHSSIDDMRNMIMNPKSKKHLLLLQGPTDDDRPKLDWSPTWFMYSHVLGPRSRDNKHGREFLEMVKANAFI